MYALVVNSLGIVQISRVEIGIKSNVTKFECFMREWNCIIRIIFVYHPNKINITTHNIYQDDTQSFRSVTNSKIIEGCVIDEVSKRIIIFHSINIY